MWFQLNFRTLHPLPPIVSGWGHSSCLESLYIELVWLSAEGWVQGGMGVQRLMTLGNQSSSPLQMGTSGGWDLPPLRWDEDPTWRGEDPSPPGGELLLLFQCFLSSRIIIISITGNPTWEGEDPASPPPATLPMLINGYCHIHQERYSFSSRYGVIQCKLYRSCSISIPMARNNS